MAALRLACRNQLVPNRTPPPHTHTRTSPSNPIHPTASQVPPEFWGNDSISIARVQDYTSYARSQGAAGVMIWSLHKKGPPSAQDIASTACSTMGMPNCSSPLPM